MIEKLKLELRPWPHPPYPGSFEMPDTQPNLTSLSYPNLYQLILDIELLTFDPISTPREKVGQIQRLIQLRLGRPEQRRNSLK